MVFQHGNTALHEAAWKGYSRCVALLSTKAALHIRNNGGFAPLHLACQNGHNQTCREILLAGCEPDIQNNVSFIDHIWTILGMDFRPILLRIIFISVRRHIFAYVSSLRSCRSYENPHIGRVSRVRPK